MFYVMLKIWIVNVGMQNRDIGTLVEKLCPSIKPHKDFPPPPTDVELRADFRYFIPCTVEP